jgi:hypothetical protein
MVNDFSYVTKHRRASGAQRFNEGSSFIFEGQAI